MSTVWRPRNSALVQVLLSLLINTTIAPNGVLFPHTLKHIHVYTQSLSGNSPIYYSKIFFLNLQHSLRLQNKIQDLSTAWFLPTWFYQPSLPLLSTVYTKIQHIRPQVILITLVHGHWGPDVSHISPFPIYIFWNASMVAIPRCYQEDLISPSSVLYMRVQVLKAVSSLSSRITNMLHKIVSSPEYTDSN